MKKFAILTVLTLFLATTASNAMDPMGKRTHRGDRNNRHGNNGNHGQTNNGTKPVGAPLDGGLLLLLGGAGVAYYTAKKQKAIKEE